MRYTIKLSSPRLGKLHLSERGGGSQTCLSSASSSVDSADIITTYHHHCDYFFLLAIIVMLMPTQGDASPVTTAGGSLFRSEEMALCQLFLQVHRRQHQQSFHPNCYRHRQHIHLFHSSPRQLTAVSPNLASLVSYSSGISTLTPMHSKGNLSTRSVSILLSNRSSQL